MRLRARPRISTAGSSPPNSARRVGLKTESKNPARADDIKAYLTDEIEPFLKELGFSVSIEHLDGAPPFLIAERFERDGVPTVLGYGHGDVVDGMDQAWQQGLSLEHDRAEWAALRARHRRQQGPAHHQPRSAEGGARDARARSASMRNFWSRWARSGARRACGRFCATYREQLKADLLIASDGPRLKETQPTIFLGSRGSLPFDLVIKAREREYHSGNWGGALSNPGDPARARHRLAGRAHRPDQRRRSSSRRICRNRCVRRSATACSRAMRTDP